MKRLWFIPIMVYSLLIDGTRYYVRLFESDYIPILMTYIQVSDKFAGVGINFSCSIVAVNRVSEQI